MLAHSHPDEAARLLRQAEQDVLERWHRYEYLAKAPPAWGAAASTEVTHD